MAARFLQAMAEQALCRKPRFSLCVCAQTTSEIRAADFKHSFDDYI